MSVDRVRQLPHFCGRSASSRLALRLALWPAWPRAFVTGPPGRRASQFPAIDLCNDLSSPLQNRKSAKVQNLKN